MFSLPQRVGNSEEGSGFFAETGEERAEERGHEEAPHGQSI